MSFLSLIARLSLNASGFQTGLKQSESAVKKWSRDVGTHVRTSLAAAFGARAIFNYTKSILDLADHTKDMSEQFDISTSEVQRLEHAAQKSGLTFEDFGQALEKFGAARNDAVTGNEAAQRSFEGLGLSMTQLADPTQRNIDLMIKLAEAIKGKQLSFQQRESLKDVFGKKGGRLTGPLSENLKQPTPFELTPGEVGELDRLKKEVTDSGKLLKRGFAKGFAASLGFGDFFGEQKARREGLGLDEQLRQSKREETARRTAASAKPGIDFIMDFLGRLSGIPSATLEGEPISLDEKEKARSKQFEAMDSLVKLGNFIGGNKNTLVDIGKEQVKQLRTISKNTGRASTGGEF
jgi:hypothetical protein